MRRAFRGGVLVCGTLCVLSGCAHMKTGGAKEVAKDQSGRSISEAEVQQDLQRYAGQYFDRNTEAMEESNKLLNPDQQFQMLKRSMLYDSSVLDIVSGKEPVVNLLDMMVFARLTRERFESYWQPQVFGGVAAPMLEALRRDEVEIWRFGKSLLGPTHTAQLEGFISKWNRENQAQNRVEMVRLSEFSRTAGNLAAADSTGGLMASVRNMSQTADAAVLLGERAMFFAQRAPFLFRLQARIAAFEVTHDSVQQLAGQAKLLDRTEVLLGKTTEIIAQSADLLERTGRLRPMLEDLSQLTNDATLATQEARLLNESLAPLAERMAPLLQERVNAQGEPELAIESVLARSNELSSRTYDLLHEVHTLLPEQKQGGRLGPVTAQVDRGLRRLMGYLALVGAAWAVFFWGGYYLVRRRIDARARRDRDSGSFRGFPPSGARPSSVG